MERKEIIEALKEAANTVTDDAEYAGVLIVGAILLNMEEAEVDELIG